MTEYKSLQIEVHHIVMCALLGNFSSVLQRPTIQFRIAVFRTFSDSKIVQELLEKHFNIVIFALKQYILHTIICIPHLRRTLLKSEKWEQFEQCGQSSMLALCGEMKHAKFPNFVECISIALDQCLTKKNHRFSAKRKNVPVKNRRIRNIVASKDQCDILKKHFMVIYECICRIPLKCETPWYLLVTLGIKREVVRAIYSEKSKAILQVLLQDDVKTTVRRFLNTCDLRKHVQVFDLALHHREQQDKAMRKRFSLADDDAIPTNLAEFVMCTQCKSLKSHSAKTSGTFGNASVLIDDETMQYFCSQHRSHKNSSVRTGAKVSSFLKHVEPKKKSRKRIDKYQHCQSTPLLKIPSRGKLLYFFGVLYMLCPQCASTSSLFDMTRVGTFLACKRCVLRTKRVHSVVENKCK